MTSKNLTIFLTLLALTPATLVSFAVINQTDTAKELELTEAYRHTSKMPDGGTSSKVVPLNDTNKPHALTVAAKSIVYFKLTQACPVMLCDVITTTVKDNTTTESRMQTCYEPYPLTRTEKASKFTDKWGLVICKPDAYNNDYANSFARRTALMQGYGIKIAHPQLLKKTTVDALPKELA